MKEKRMKPIIIFAEEPKDGKVMLTQEELQRIVDKAYEQGKADGSDYYTAPSPLWEYVRVI